MVFVLEDDNCIHRYASAEDAARSIEPIDVGKVMRAVFDDHGRPLAVRWIEKPKTQGFLVGGGRYELLPSGAPDLTGFRKFIARADETPRVIHDVLRELEANR